MPRGAGRRRPNGGLTVGNVDILPFRWRRAVRRLFLTGVLALVAGGSSCADNYRITKAENFFTYERPFTDATAEMVRKDAESLCSDRKMVAIQTSNVCDMTKCFTVYQCVSKGALPELVR